MNSIKYQQIVDQLRAADHPIQELTIGGRVAVSLIGGRVAAMTFSAEDENLLWSSPQLADTELLRQHPEQLVGGIGGDRLWFAPEFAYHWDGKPDLVEFTNMKVSVNEDPAPWQFVETDDHSVNLQMETELTDYRDGKPVAFEVERTITNVASPLPTDSPLMTDVQFVGIRTQHLIRFLRGDDGKRVGLWHLLQMPAGATLIVPTRGQPEPLEYFNKGKWEARSDHLCWAFSGTENAKIGFNVHQVTGRTAVVSPLADGRMALVIRQFPVMPGLTYCDGPSQEQAVDQSMQCWDGFGFGEMEYHSPAVGASPLSKEYAESALLWAFGGSTQAITRIAQELLGVHVEA